MLRSDYVGTSKSESKIPESKISHLNWIIKGFLHGISQWNINSDLPRSQIKNKDCAPSQFEV